MRKEELIPFGQRIRAVRKALEKSQLEFAASMDISNSFLSTLEAGKTKASYDFFFNISHRHNVNIHFLLHGTGEMFSDQQGEEGDKKIDFGAFSDQVHEMLWYFERSPLVKMAVLEHFSRYLYDNELTISKDIKKHKDMADKIAQGE
jgi:transcriptional regulator with XRE-family HTH domain